MRLKIKNLKGQQFNIDFQLSDCILDIKNRIHEEKKIIVDQQKLVYKGKVMENTAILSDMGVKDEDNFVLMKFVEKKQVPKEKQSVAVDEKKMQKKVSSAEKKEAGVEKNSNINEKNVEKLVKLGYDKKQAEQVLKNTGYVLQKAIQQLFEQKKAEGKQITSNQILRHEILRSLAENQHPLENPNGQSKIFTGSARIKGLLEHNQRLQQLLLQNPNALNQLLLSDQDVDIQEEYEQEENEDGQQQEQEEQYIVDINFSEDQEKAIQRLIDLGFQREHVIEAYLACEKNQEMAADMLFRQKDNHDFD